MKLSRVCLSLILFLLFSVSGITQQFKRILGEPEKYTRPFNYASDQAKHREFLSAVKSNSRYSRDKAWVVVCVNDGALTFSSKELKTKRGNALKYLDYFNVVEETDFALHIIKFKDGISPDGLKMPYANAYVDFGWVSKDDMLLWLTALRDPYTEIHQKAFLLNKRNEFKKVLESRDLVKVYSGPTSGKIVNTKPIFSFLYVYKYSNGRYLVGYSSNLSTYDFIQFLEDGNDKNSNIAGWIDQSRLELWNTRLCLEPNYSSGALSERRSNDNFIIRIYDNQESAEKASIHGYSASLSSEVIWENDPVVIDEDYLVKGQNRFKGSVTRFPVLSRQSTSSQYSIYFRTGVIGEITLLKGGSIRELLYAELEKAISQKLARSSEQNVLIAIQGNDIINSSRKNSIVRALKESHKKWPSNSNVKYTVIVYRDSKENSAERHYSISKTSSDIEAVISFINAHEFRRWNDFDDHSILFYALKKGILSARFNPNTINSLFIFGSEADISGSRTRNFKSDKYFVDAWDIVDLIDKNDVNVNVFNVDKNGSASNRIFLLQMQKLILESARKNFDRYKEDAKKISGSNIASPSIESPVTSNRVYLANGTFYASINALNSTASDLESFLPKTISNINGYIKDINDELSTIVYQGNPIDPEKSAGPLSIWVAKLINASLEGKDLPADLFEGVNDTKFKLYEEGFIPKFINGTKYPSMSYVLFFHKEDLKNYIDVIDGLRLAMDEPMDVKRERVYSFLVSLFEKYSGNYELSKKNKDDVSVNEIRNLMQGLYGEGLALDFEEMIDFEIGDIFKPRKLSDQRVDQFIRRALDNTKELQLIYDKGDKYEYAYTVPTARGTQDVYFWIPVEKTF